MREIKFRAWNRKTKEMFPVHELEFHKISNTLQKCVGYGDHDKDGWTVYGGGNNNYANGDRYVLMQYTGLKDKNGKEIYEGDVVRSVALSNDHHQRGAITISPVEYWNGNACLSITFTPIFPFIVDHEIEVIGNIYENPDLLPQATETNEST